MGQTIPVLSLLILTGLCGAQEPKATNQNKPALYHGLPAEVWEVAFRYNSGDFRRRMPAELLRKHADVLGPNAETWSPSEDLRKLKEGDPEGIPVLTELLHSKDRFAISGAAACLGRCDARHDQVLTILLGELRKTKNSNAVGPIFNAIKRLDKKACDKDGIAIMGSRLLEPELFHDIVFHLGHYGPDAKPALPALLNILRGVWIGGSPSDVALAAMRIDPKEAGPLAEPLLLKDLKNLDYVMQSRAISGLKSLGSAASFAVPTLTELLKSYAGDSPPELVGREVRITWIAGLLMQLDPKASESVAMPALISLMKTDDYVLRRHALKAIDEAGPPAKAAVPILQFLLEKLKEDEAMQQEITQALKKIQR